MAMYNRHHGHHAVDPDETWYLGRRPETKAPSSTSAFHGARSAEVDHLLIASRDQSIYLSDVATVRTLSRKAIPVFTARENVTLSIQKPRQCRDRLR
jgi:hypothetical protein